jgi:glutathione synthase/RimK-type ligase-like ATP-grasp enzyme
MDGEFITDRKMEAILQEITARRGIKHRVYSTGWVHYFARGDKQASLIGYKWSLNDAAASGIASDKVATYEVLNAGQIPAIVHQLVRTKTDVHIQWPRGLSEQFVLKPLVGTSGHGVRLFDARSDAEEYIREQQIVAWAVSPYLKIEREVRVIVLDGTVLLAYEKHPPVRETLTFFNLGKGATAKIIDISTEQTLIAKNAAATIGLRLAAVDIVWVNDSWQVLEVNDGFMMEHFLRQSKDYYQRTVKLYETILDAAFS